jgi:rubrerythrin
MPTTADNLLDAVNGEHYEFTDMYKRHENDARSEGFIDLAEQFKGVGQIESTHEARYRALLEDVKLKKFFKRNTEII